jgi:hypothetical protein
MSKLSFLVLAALAVVISYVPIVHAPLDWVETFFHEISHGLAAMVSGGQVVRIELHLGGSGLCYTTGGARVLVSFAGYAGAVLWGALLYLAVGVSGPRFARILVAALGIIIVTAAIMLARDIVTLAILAVILGIVIAAYAAGRYRLTRSAVQFIALYVMLSAARTPLHLVDGVGIGDGNTLADLTGVPEIVWVLIWEGIAIATLWLVYRAHQSAQLRPEGAVAPETA